MDPTAGSRGDRRQPDAGVPADGPQPGEAQGLLRRGLIAPRTVAPARSRWFGRPGRGQVPEVEFPGASDRIASEIKEWEERYAHGEERPLGSYLGLLLTYLSGVAGLIFTGRVRGVRVPQRIP